MSRFPRTRSIFSGAMRNGRVVGIETSLEPDLASCRLGVERVEAAGDELAERGVADVQ